MVQTLEFFMYYTVFFLFVIFISGLLGQTIFTGTSGIENLPKATGWDLINPFYIVPTLTSLFSISTEFQIIFILLVSPFIVGLIWVIAGFIRGVLS